MTEKITIQLIRTQQELLKLEANWNALLQQSRNNCVFLTWEWIKNWWEVFGGKKQLYILSGYTQQGKLAGIAPLMTRYTHEYGIPLRSLEFLGSGYESLPDHISFISGEKCHKGFIEAVFTFLAEKGEWDIINLRDMREDADFINGVQSILGGRYRSLARVSGVSPYVELSGDWEQYLKSLSMKWRYNVRAKERKLAKSHAVSFELVRSHEELPAVFRSFEELHKQRMNQKGVRDSHSRNPFFWEFHRKLAHDFLKKEYLLMGLLKADNRVVACQYAFQYNNTIYNYQIGLDSSFNDYGVGVILTAKMIEESINRGMLEYDFLRGGEEYKFHWAKKSRNITELAVWNNTPLARAAYALSSLKGFIRSFYPTQIN